MDGEKRNDFEERIAQINKIIASPILLREQFQKKVDSLYEYRMLALEPFNNKVIKKMQQMKIFPRLVRREQRKSMLMRIRCESNSELLMGVLKKYFNL